ncbi:NAD(P)/FAD-dependent oxidoreductase [Feifania hominis]|uniref:NAD(P)/FAD-dependent oxidoreductase n=1 Tax=Feifania hominis TaxID=2763660 RepID=A0A926DCY2_9FIRM|nr:NAD(P)/FAD-dependent oxidoreductase [Feifania hominis]MBC8535524.1 NAD(P)/FAD-dependent oxidoreductase [Feifania hominis]
MHKVIVIGGGPAGLMAAGAAAQQGHEVCLLEKNDVVGRKLLITGKGRCNVTNNCDRDTFLKNIPVNARFLYSALSRFSPADTMAFFEELGVPLKTERGARVFPQSDRAADIRNALRAYVEWAGADIKKAQAAHLIVRDGRIRGVVLSTGEELPADDVIVATGGLSYRETGSTGDGYDFAREAGHAIVPPKASLVPLNTLEHYPADMMGLSLRNVTLRVIDGRKNRVIFEELGELLFTHFGVSGPLALSASSHMREMENGRYRLVIDLKPALDSDTLDRRILRDFELFKNREFRNCLVKLLPSSMIPVVVKLSGIAPDKQANAVTRAERRALVELMKAFPLTVSSFRPIEEAIVTSGGIDVRELNPSTMESKLVRGLYFAGEVLDVDGYTGGFNLQIAFSTGRLAGRSVREGTQDE